MTQAERIAEYLSSVGFKVAGIEEGTQQTDPCISLENGFHVTIHGKRKYYAVRETPTGSFIVYPVRDAIFQVVENDIIPNLEMVKDVA